MKILDSSDACPGARALFAGSKAPALAALLGVLAVGCSNEETTHRLEPVMVGMTDTTAPVFDDGETTLYEVKLPVQLPMVAPTQGELRDLNSKNIPPYPRAPWVLEDDVDVQITWTLSNLDSQNHNVHLLIDPWNEFGRYWPAIAVVNDDEQIPNLSGIQFYFELPGTQDGRPSRRHGTITFEDMEELAIDFATVMNIIENVQPVDPNAMGGAQYGDTGDPVALVNHAFSFRNRSHNDILIQQYIPQITAGLTGFDLGLRMNSAGNVAVEVVVELVDKGKGRVAAEEDYNCQNGVCVWQGDNEHTLIEPPTDYITVGGAAAP